MTGQPPLSARNRKVLAAVGGALAFILILVTVIVLLSSGTPTTGSSTSTSAPSDTPSAADTTPIERPPIPDSPYFADPKGHYPTEVRQAAEQLRAEGRATDADRLEYVSKTSFALWYTRAADLTGQIPDDLKGAKKADKPALHVIYRIPGRDCGLFSEKGAQTSAKKYLAELRAYVRLVNKIGADVVTILEPDAVTQYVDTNRPKCKKSNPGRMKLLSDAVSVLKSSPHIKVLIDAGNEGWLSPEVMIPALNQAGGKKADGVAVNVSNAKDTKKSVEYGLALLDGKDGMVVVDSGRNGNGPLLEGDPDLTWCNPTGRAFGPFPGVDLDHANVWYAYVKLQGESDGDCERGEPTAGTLMPDWLADLAANTGW